jgi:uncharacterized protein YoxC
MDNWSVVLVVVTLAGLGAAIVNPIVSLTKSITTLTVVVEDLQKDVSGLTTKNSESHERIWKHEERQDTRLDDHEIRIIRIEGK